MGEVANVYYLFTQYIMYSQFQSPPHMFFIAYINFQIFFVFNHNTLLIFQNVQSV